VDEVLQLKLYESVTTRQPVAIKGGKLANSRGRPVIVLATCV
jgi:hypothetical protein